MSTVLIVDDEQRICWALEECLKDDGYTVLITSNAKDAIGLLEKSSIDVVLLDIKLPGMDGMEALQRIKAMNKSVLVILMTAHGGAQTTIQAMQSGAYDYLTKPLDIYEIKRVVKKAVKSRSQGQGITLPNHEVLERFRIGNLVGKSPKMQDIFKMIGLLTTNDATVLLHGESGVGKELVAKAIHFNSRRSSFPFVETNCTAIHDDLLEKEIFGIEEGDLSDSAAKTAKFTLTHGKLYLANKGTIFFDEVGDLSPALQGKLLRVLQEKTFYRVGGKESISVDTRIIAATHKDLELEVREGRFREDLYYRLNVVSVHIPPLRERREDIPYLIKYFLMRLNNIHGKDITGVDDDVMDTFMRYAWPGNVRELENALERAAVIARGGSISIEHLPAVLIGRDVLENPFVTIDQVIKQAFLHSVAEEPQEGESLFTRIIQRAERSVILAALEYCKWNQVRASKVLGINRSTLRNKLDDYNLIQPEQEGEQES